MKIKKFESNYLRVPIRKPGKYIHIKPDPHLTGEKFIELKKKLENLRKSVIPAADEVRRTAAMGDLSENAAYQVAKGRLRSIHERILELDAHLKHAVIIQPMKNNKTLNLGHTVSIELEGKKYSYLLLGSTQADPSSGIISHNSPMGSALMGHKVGDKVRVRLKNTEIECTIISIE